MQFQELRAMIKPMINPARVSLIVLLAMVLSGCSPDRDWQAALNRDTIDGYKNFLEHHRDTAYNSLAESRIAALKEQQSWTTAQRLDSIASYQAYLASFPTGLYVKVAESRVGALTSALNSTDADAPPPASLIPDRKIDSSAQPPAAEHPSEPTPAAAPTATPGSLTANATASAPPAPAAAPSGTAPPPAEGATKPKAKTDSKSESDSKDHPVRAQVGVFSKHDGAELAQKQAQSSVHGGDVNFRIQELDRGDHQLWRVDSNPVSREAAHQICETLRKRSLDCAIVPH